MRKPCWRAPEGVASLGLSGCRKKTCGPRRLLCLLEPTVCCSVDSLVISVTSIVVRYHSAVRGSVTDSPDLFVFVCSETQVKISNRVLHAAYGQQFLQTMASVYVGYHVTRSIAEVIVGTVYGVVDGLIGGAVFAWLYNQFAKPGV